MISHNTKLSNLFIYWIYTSLILVFCIIIVGGLTRLTNSGLSITEWELFTGIFPPLNDKAWSNYFELYKKIPQYQLISAIHNIDSDVGLKDIVDAAPRFIQIAQFRS